MMFIVTLSSAQCKSSWRGFPAKYLVYVLIGYSEINCCVFKYWLLQVPLLFVCVCLTSVCPMSDVRLSDV